MKSTQSTRRLRGFTMLEGALFLGVVGISLGALWVAIDSVSNSKRLEAGLIQVLKLVNNIKAVYSTANVANGDILDMAKAGAVPQDMVTLDAQGVPVAVTDVWGGPVTLSYPMGNDVFVLSFGAVPKTACSQMLVKIAGQGRANGPSLVGVSGQDDPGVPAQNEGFAAIPGGGMTAGGAANLCREQHNTVSFGYQVKS